MVKYKLIMKIVKIKSIKEIIAQLQTLPGDNPWWFLFELYVSAHVYLTPTLAW